MSKFDNLKRNKMPNNTQWELWEVFVQPSDGKAFEHVGSVHGADAELALQNARDLYSRRGNVVNIWIVPSSSIVATTPDEKGPFFDPANDRVYLHPNFYKIPRGVNVDIE